MARHPRGALVPPKLDRLRSGDVVWADRPPPRYGKGPWVVTEGICGGEGVFIGNKISYLLRPFNAEHSLVQLARISHDTTDCVRMSARCKLRKLTPLELLALAS